MDIEQLKREFGIAGQLHFSAGEGGLPMMEIDNGQATARVSIYAGQLLSYQPTGAGDDLLFLGGKAYFETGKAIKGGIPICWPWFGPDPEGKGRPGHGFARSWPWSVISTQALADGSTEVRLGIADDAATRAIWPHTFNLFQVITVGPTLKLELITLNAGDVPFSITQGFHSYFKVGDINRTRVQGLEGLGYIDKLADNARKTQNGEVLIDAEVDRVYEGVDRALTIDDAAIGRRIRVRGSNSSTCVVWNPWADTARAMADLDDDDYRKFVCVETLNAGSEVIEVPARGEVRIGVEIGVEA
jgi:glucose-6-phosphate 1-epimerase